MACRESSGVPDIAASTNGREGLKSYQSIAAAQHGHDMGFAAPSKKMPSAMMRLLGEHYENSPPTILHWAAGAAALIAPTAVTTAQDWPTRPVTMIVPYAAGGGVDGLARIVAPRLSEHLGQQVIIENAGGAGGQLAAARVTKARPDGYQFLHGDVGIDAQSQALYKKPPYNTATDFAPVGLIYEQPMVLLARRNLPVGNLQEFVAYAKANAAKMQFASPGVGNATHLACTRLNLAFGLNVTHVPYRGNAPAMQDMIAGRIDYLCGTVTVAIPRVAVLSKNRSPALADLASTQEQGANNLASDA